MSKIRLELKKFNPYFCSNKELNEKRFSIAFKREIMQNIKCKVSINGNINKKIDTKNEVDIES
jgi:hypothetical protein